MRSICSIIAITAAGLLLFAGFAQASDVEAELRQMQERITDLESQLEDEKDSLLPTQEEAGSALSSILENTDVTGHVAASYNYNFEGFDNGAAAAAAAAGNRTNVASSHGTSNSFQFDQARIAIDNAADENGRGGANLTLDAGAADGGGNGLAVYTANVSYLAPVGNGLLVEAGIVETLIGSEVNDTTANFNVTRGIVFDLQPTVNLGARVGTNLTDDISATIGLVNDPGAAGVGLANDNNNEKAVVGQLAWSGDDCGASFNFSWGDLPGDVGEFIGNVVLTYDGMEDVSMWFDYTVVSLDDGAAEGEIHGIAAAARMALGDDMGVAVRGEVTIQDDDATENNAWSLTFTGDKSLTDHLTAKAEVRLDFDKNNLVDDEGAAGEDVAALVLAQLVYEF